MRPLFEELHSWFELLVRRQELAKVMSYAKTTRNNELFKLPVPPEVNQVRDEVFTRYALDHLNSIDDLSEIEESSCTASQSD